MEKQDMLFYMPDGIDAKKLSAKTDLLVDLLGVGPGEICYLIYLWGQIFNDPAQIMDFVEYMEKVSEKEEAYR